mgnify:CR=1 FL=1
MEVNIILHINLYFLGEISFIKLHVKGLDPAKASDTSDNIVGLLQIDDH